MTIALGFAARPASMPIDGLARRWGAEEKDIEQEVRPTPPGDQLPGAPTGYQLNWNSSTRQWDLFWGGTPGSGAMHFAGGLPRAGHVTFDDGLWFGVEGGFNRITSACADNSVGSEQWLIDAGVNRGLVGCFTAGDHIVNRSNAVPFPRAWRAVESGGWSANVINEAEWQAETPYSAGDSVKPTNPATTTLFRAKNTGTSGADEPAWTTTRDSLVYEAGITWECVGPYGESIIEPVGIQSEVLGTYEVDADAVLTLRECSYERLKLTGAPVAARELEMPSVDGASGWRRVIWNTTGQLMTIKGSMGDAGITVPDGSAYDVMSDGTDCVRVE